MLALSFAAGFLDLAQNDIAVLGVYLAGGNKNRSAGSTLTAQAASL